LIRYLQEASIFAEPKKKNGVYENSSLVLVGCFDLLIDGLTLGCGGPHDHLGLKGCVGCKKAAGRGN